MQVNNQIYAVYDTVAESFGFLFECANDMVAKRTVNNGFSNNPDKKDYKLIKLGQFDHSTGHILIHNPEVEISLETASTNE